jgi:hypothetical protein
LRVRFLGQYKDEYLHQFYERVYDKYQQELHLKFEPFFEELLKCFQPDKREELEPELFEFDIMNNIDPPLIVIPMHKLVITYQALAN